MDGFVTGMIIGAGLALVGCLAYFVPDAMYSKSSRKLQREIINYERKSVVRRLDLLLTSSNLGPELRGILQNWRSEMAVWVDREPADVIEELEARQEEAG